MGGTNEVTGRLIWFFGGSAAGKDTLIDRIASQPDYPLRQHLNIEDPVAVCEPSLDTDKPRGNLAQVICERQEDGLTQLIKGQSPDISTPDHKPDPGVPGQLSTLLPRCQQEVVFVSGDPAKLRRRALLRAAERNAAFERGERPHGDRYTLEWPVHNFVLEMTWVSGWVAALHLPIVWVDNSGDVPVIGSPPP